MKPQPFYIVWSDKDSLPFRQHPSYQSALSEAEFLARERPAKNFFILKAIAVSQKLDVVTVLIEDLAEERAP